MFCDDYLLARGVAWGLLVRYNQRVLKQIDGSNCVQSRVSDGERGSGNLRHFRKKDCGGCWQEPMFRGLLFGCLPSLASRTLGNHCSRPDLERYLSPFLRTLLLQRGTTTFISASIELSASAGA